ncbi:MAG: extracellular solute-binding protein [Verrucomicrobiota bacterium]
MQSWRRRLMPSFLGVTLYLTVTIPCLSKEELIIVSPHWEGIQYEFGRAFEAHYKETFGNEVRVRWRDLGGTSQIEKALDASYEATPDSSQIDIFFGGGIDPYESQKEKGHLHPYPLPQHLLKEIPVSIGGFPIVDPEYHFYGAALSSFGILENKRVTKILDLPTVTSWEDLTNERLLSWVSSADPRKSGSVHMIYEIILQGYGWEKGWSIIYRSSGNVRSFLQSSSAPTKEVSTGDAAYAVAIDINGMTQQAFLGKENVNFTIPKDVSVINPDGIAILKGAPNLKAAKAFVDFVMSPKGQGLWMIPKGQQGGAKKFGITRMGILPSFYEGDLSKLLVPLNPFKTPYSFRYDSTKGSRRWGVVNDLIGQSIIDVHSHLRSAWIAIQNAPKHRQNRLFIEFSKPLISEEQAAHYGSFWRKDKIQARSLANQWMRQSVNRFKRIQKQATIPTIDHKIASKAHESITQRHN